VKPTVQQFFDVGAEPLSLRSVGGDVELGRTIPEFSINRPGLALTGFFRYFAHRRIQVLGLAEMTYLKSLHASDCRDRLRRFFDRAMPCVVISRNLRPLPEMTELAQASRTPLFRSSLVTGDFLQRASVLMADLSAPTLKIQGTMVDMMGIGVLIEGSPGIGKSETALSLIARGFSLVSDDVTEIRRTGSGILVATAPESTRYHMDIRGLGIVHVPSLYGVASVRRSKRLDMIIQLQACDLPTATTTAPEPGHRELLGVSVPCYSAPVAPGRDATHIVVTAALNFRLRELGHDAAKELDQKLMRLLVQDRMRGQTGD